MRCMQVRQKLAGYLAGELPLPEERQVERHLQNCNCCRDEKAALEKLDSMLDTWIDEAPPPGLAEDIMFRVRNSEQVSAAPPSTTRHFKVMARNLACAAVITLVLFWSGFFNPGNFITAGDSLNGAVHDYTRVAAEAVDEFVAVTSSYTEKITNRSEEY